MKNKEISLRRLINIDDDYNLLEKWYQQKEIYLYFEQRKLNFNEIKNKGVKIVSQLVPNEPAIDFMKKLTEKIK